MNTPLNTTKLSQYFDHEDGTFKIFLRLTDGSFLPAKLNGSIWLGDFRLCPIRSAEDLELFLSGIQAKMVNSSGVVTIHDVTDQIIEHDFLLEIIAVTGVDPERLQKDVSFRGADYVMARQLHMKVRHEALKMSLAKSAAIYNKDHSTCLHAVRTVRNRMKTDRGFRERTANLMRMIGEYK